jgi:Beta-lactamase enzyme family
MRRSAGRASHLAVIFAFALIATACASPPTDAPPSTPSTTPASTTPQASASTPTTTKSPSKPKPTSPFASLVGYVASRPGVVTAAVYDARTNTTWVFHPGVREDTASIVKVEIMGTALKQAQDAGSPLPGTELALMQTMIENSDNNAATELLKDDGGPSRVQAFDESAGMTHTTVSTLAFIPGSTTLPGWGLTLTTASDEVKLVRKFAYANSLLNSTDRKYGLGLMENVESDQAWGVSGGVPPGVTVALKNGWLPLDLANDTNWQIDSIGWIHGNGRDYVLAVLSNGNPTMDDGIATINYIAAKIYSELGPAG